MLLKPNIAALYDEEWSSWILVFEVTTHHCTANMAVVLVGCNPLAPAAEDMESGFTSATLQAALVVPAVVPTSSAAPCVAHQTAAGAGDLPLQSSYMQCCSFIFTDCPCGCLRSRDYLLGLCRWVLARAHVAWCQGSVAQAGQVLMASQATCTNTRIELRVGYLLVVWLCLVGGQLTLTSRCPAGCVVMCCCGLQVCQGDVLLKQCIRGPVLQRIMRATLVSHSGL
ncbi:hypothetical protein COO60DRAFT_1469937 [Scenedesmus sp. NREL 46B-D3]|nr:hypothetical protein COO60DRAFT_1469937 [Scenedesmus sp. NREL 46B-D3]